MRHQSYSVRFGILIFFIYKHLKELIVISAIGRKNVCLDTHAETG